MSFFLPLKVIFSSRTRSAITMRHQSVRSSSSSAAPSRRRFGLRDQRSARSDSHTRRNYLLIDDIEIVLANLHRTRHVLPPPPAALSSSTLPLPGPSSRSSATRCAGYDSFYLRSDLAPPSEPLFTSPMNYCDF